MMTQTPYDMYVWEDNFSIFSCLYMRLYVQHTIYLIN